MRKILSREDFITTITVMILIGSEEKDISSSVTAIITLLII